MLIRRAVLDGIVVGTVDLAFRRWRKPAVRAGSTLRTAVGVLAVDAVDVVPRATAAEARRAGFPTLAALRSEVDSRPGDLYRIALRFVGEDPRIALRSDVEVGDEVLTRLSRMDWSGRFLRLIQASPGVRAADLAASVGEETLKFKQKVRRLKELGLTESLEVGYRLSPRGEVVLRLTDA